MSISAPSKTNNENEIGRFLIRYAGLYPASDEITQLPDFHPLKPGEGDTEPLPLKGPLYLFGSLCESALEERG